MIRILIGDDRASMRNALKVMFALRPQWVVCGEAEDFPEVMAKALELRPDVIVVDFKMPPFNGIESVRKIARVLPSVPIIMYTLYKTEELEAAAKSAGARSVVGKEQGIQYLLAAIEAELATST